MPTRLLREAILDSERVCSLSFPAEVLYRRLMSVVDDFGRFDGRLSVLRSRLYPLQIEKVREADIERWIAECVKAGLIVLYSVSAKPYILFRNLGEPRAKESKYPAPPSESERTQPHASENICAQTQTDVNRRAQLKTDVPYSSSYSDSISDSDAKGGGPDVPAALAGEEFRSAWKDWLAYRHERKLTMTARTLGSQLKMLEKLGVHAAIETIEASIRNGWQGLFPEKSNGDRNPSGRDRFRADTDSVADKYTPDGIARLRAGAAGPVEGPATAMGPADGASPAEPSTGEAGGNDGGLSW